jgi:hypothetical protein
MIRPKQFTFPGQFLSNEKTLQLTDFDGSKRNSVLSTSNVPCMLCWTFWIDDIQDKLRRTRVCLRMSQNVSSNLDSFPRLKWSQSGHPHSMTVKLGSSDLRQALQWAINCSSLDGGRPSRKFSSNVDPPLFRCVYPFSSTDSFESSLQWRLHLQVNSVRPDLPWSPGWIPQSQVRPCIHSQNHQGSNPMSRIGTMSNRSNMTSFENSWRFTRMNTKKC